MNNHSPYRGLTPMQFAALMDAAKERATQARREAINDFWDAVARHARTAWRAVAGGVLPTQHRLHDRRAFKTADRAQSPGTDRAPCATAR
jgi:hypothetical protein